MKEKRAILLAQAQASLQQLKDYKQTLDTQIAEREAKGLDEDIGTYMEYRQAEPGALKKIIEAYEPIIKRLGPSQNGDPSQEAVTSTELLKVIDDTKQDLQILRFNSKVQYTVRDIVCSMIAIVLLPIGAGFMIYNAIERGTPFSFFDTKGDEAARKLEEIAFDFFEMKNPGPASSP